MIVSNNMQHTLICGRPDQHMYYPISELSQCMVVQHATSSHACNMQHLLMRGRPNQHATYILSELTQCIVVPINMHHLMRGRPDQHAISPHYEVMQCLGALNNMQHLFVANRALISAPNFAHLTYSRYNDSYKQATLN